MSKTSEILTSKEKKLRFCFIDLFNIRTEEEFYEALATTVIKSSSNKWEQWVENAKKYFQRLTPRFNIGSDPTTDFSLSLDWAEVRKNPDEILDLPEQISRDKKLRIVICIDEFQNISFFRDPLQFQKKIRSHWQRHQETAYVIYGSKRHMMTEIFNHPSMPLYKFGDTIMLEKIQSSYWVSHIQNEFMRTGKTISEDLAGRVSLLMEDHPYFVQQLAYEVWNLTDHHCNEEVVEQALTDLLTKNTILYLRDLDNLTNMQINFLKALCKDVRQFSASTVLAEYRLGTSGNVNRIKTALVSKEIIDIFPGKIDFLDPLYKIWFKRIYLKEIQQRIKK